MRSMTYAIAALAAVGIMIGIATIPPADQSTDESHVAGESQPADETQVSLVKEEPGTLVLSVPEMSCEFACYPKVKQLLESNDSVTDVVLDEQKEEGTIDNRQVVVNYDAGFDVGAAILLLDKNGFPKSNIVQ